MADLILFVILVAILFAGWRMGTISVLANIGSFVLAYQLGRTYSATWAEQLTALIPGLSPGASEGSWMALVGLFIDSGALANRLVQIALFVVIFIVVRWLVAKIAGLLTGLFGGTVLGAINHALGALLALALAAVVIVIIDSVLLPTCVRLGFGAAVAAFMDGSDIIMPLLYDLPFWKG